MDRDRVAGWLATAADHPHYPTMKALLDGYDRVKADLDVVASELARVSNELTAAKSQARNFKADAERLAAWIIAHPSGHDPSEVLALHDRTV